MRYRSSGKSDDGRLRFKRYRHPRLRYSRSPPPCRDRVLEGEGSANGLLPGSGSWSSGIDRTVEKQAGLTRFVKVPAADGKGHQLNLWIVGDAGGFQVLRFTDWYSQTPHGKAIFAEAVAE